MKRREFILLGAACLLLTLLWLPGLKYPVTSDVSAYALLGRSIWEHGQYSLDGAPYGRFLPFHAFTAYPFMWLFGLHVGIKVATLLAGMGIVIVAYALMRRQFSEKAAIIAVAAILFHPAFILMTQMASADLLFTLLFLASLLAFIDAEKRPRSYVAAWILTGLMCLTRYNGIPIAAFYGLWILWRRRAQIHSPWLWIGAGLAGILVGSWFLRNTILFDTPLPSDYAGELDAEAPSLLAQFLSNAVYYGNPIHNIFPFFLPFALYGVWRERRRGAFLIAAMLAAWALTAIWWVQAMRFAFPGYVILLGFGAVGLMDIYKRYFVNSLIRSGVVIILLIGFVGIHAPAICLYTYGECNAWFDRTVGWLPKDLGLTPEGFHAFHQAREYFNAHAEHGATIAVESGWNAETWKEGVFRTDIVVKNAAECGAYHINQQLPGEGDEVLFSTTDAPVTRVMRKFCD